MSANCSCLRGSLQNKLTFVDLVTNIFVLFCGFLMFLNILNWIHRFLINFWISNVWWCTLKRWALDVLTWHSWHSLCRIHHHQGDSAQWSTSWGGSGADPHQTKMSELWTLQRPDDGDGVAGAGAGGLLPGRHAGPLLPLALRHPRHLHHLLLGLLHLPVWQERGSPLRQAATL